MHDKGSGARSSCADVFEDDLDVEALVLRQILSLYPETLTFEELVRRMSNGSADFAQRDLVERAVRELAGEGLLNRVGEMVLPTRAACYFDEIVLPA